MQLKLCTKCEKHLPFDSFSRRSASIDGFQSHCKQCKADYQRKNPNRREVSKRYRDKNKKQCVERTLTSRQKRPEYYAEKQRLWAQENRERVLSLRRQWYKNNRGVEIARCRRRAGRIRQDLRGLSAAHKVEIQGLYDFCSIFPQYEVDHIVPLNGKTVCGLHVPWNMQVLLISENRKKGNKLMPNPRAVSRA